MLKGVEPGANLKRSAGLARCTINRGTTGILSFGRGNEAVGALLAIVQLVFGIVYQSGFGRRYTTGVKALNRYGAERRLNQKGT